jgi:deazaflavin-dependent oxidoreductase (nitroreductase family)
MGNAPVVLLTTTGRKSGKRRTLPLLGFKDGETWYVIASMGGSPRHPAWYLNLQKQPRCTLQVRGRKLEVTASDAPPDLRQRLYDQAAATWKGYAEYQKKTTRVIPVVLLKQGPT